MIEAEHLTKSFSYHTKEAGLKNTFRDFFFRKKTERQVVKDVSFHIDDGEIVGFLGPNGAGKTTTIKMLSGILHPTLGTARVLGYVPWERKQEFRRQIAVVMGQKSQLWPDLPASESLLMNKCIYDIDDASYRRVLGEFTEMLDVGHVMNVQVRRLSLGERMKLEIIAALLHHPRVIFLDEPTIGLDIQAQKSIRNFIREYNRAEKATILLTSHQMQDIEELCRRAAVPVTPEKIAGYLLLFLMGCVWLYALQMVPALLSFVLVKTEGIFQAFYGLHDLNKVPMDIYGKVIQRLGTFLIPIFPMVNYPGRFLTGYLKGWQMAYGILMPLALFGVIRALWKLALRKYTSANG